MAYFMGDDTSNRMMANTFQQSTATIDFKVVNPALSELLKESHLSFSAVKPAELGLQRGLSTLIWAPNGVGKTTLFKSIIAAVPNLEACVYVDYENYKDDVLPKNATEIVVSANVARIEKLKSDREIKIRELEFDRVIRGYLNITNVATAKAAFGEGAEYHPVSAGLNIARDFSKEAAVALWEATINLCDDERVFLARHAHELCRASVDKALLDEQKEHLYQSALRQIEAIIDEDCKKCPVCGSTIKIPLIDEIRKRKRALTQLKKTLVSEYYKTCDSDAVPVSKICQRVEKMADIVAANKANAAISFACVFGRSKVMGVDFDQALGEILLGLEQVRRITSQLTQLEKQRDDFYELLKMQRECLEDVYTAKFDAKSVRFDDDSKSVTIDLGRKAETFSAGEQNLMALTARTMAFKASNAALLLVDDPLSSLDIANQYEIMFNLIEAVGASGKGNATAIVLTHNLNCINIALSQGGSGFGSIKMLNRYRTTGGKDRVELLDLKVLKRVDGKSRGNRAPIATKLFNSASFVEALRFSLCAASSLDEKTRVAYERKIDYIEACQARFSPDEDGHTQLHDLYHFSQDGEVNVTFNGTMLRRNELLDAIEGFNVQTLDEGEHVFPCFIIDGIFLCIALRIWVEQHLYQALSDDSKEKWRACKTFGNKINLVFPDGGDVSLRLPGLDNVSRNFLLSLKVMANQSEHMDSQPYPYEYAINLSASQLTSLILRVKRRFNCGC